jgi:hypothetical protein
LVSRHSCPDALAKYFFGGKTLDVNLNDTYIVIKHPFESFGLPVMVVMVFVVWLIRIVASGKPSIFAILVFAASCITFTLILTHAVHLLGKWQGHLDTGAFNCGNLLKGGVLMPIKPGEDYWWINITYIYAIQLFIIVALIFSLYKSSRYKESGSNIEDLAA